MKKRILFIFLYCLASILIILLIFEFIYRNQVIDTYLPELRSFNKEENLKAEKKKTILIMGDSFTALKVTGYPDTIQKRWQNYRIINSSIPGTGIIEALIIAPGRFKKFKPDIFIYQIYVGNDLFNISYPVNWRELSVLRNLYWTIAGDFRFVSFLNYRLGQIRQARLSKNSRNPVRVQSTERNDTFSAEEFDNNKKLYLKAEPGILENHILVKEKRKKDFSILLNKLEKLLFYCRQGSCRSYILVIPHFCQVDRRYLENMKLLGARFSAPEQILNEEYPFIIRLREKFKRWKNVHILNPIALLKKNEKENNSVYYMNSAYLNPRGQKVIAEFLMDNIRH